jgi:hypothetical protein
MPKTLVSVCQIVLCHIPGDGNVYIQWWPYNLLFVWAEWRDKLVRSEALCLHLQAFSVSFKDILNDWSYKCFPSRLNVPGRYIAVWPLHDRLSSGHAVTTVTVHSVGHSATYLVATIHAAIRTSNTNGYCITLEFLVCSTHWTGEVMDYQIIWNISQFLQRPQSLQIIFV